MNGIEKRESLTVAAKAKGGAAMAAKSHATLRLINYS